VKARINSGLFLVCLAKGTGVGSEDCMTAKKKTASRGRTATSRTPVQPSLVKTIVNGQVQGMISSNGTIGDAAMALSRDAGLKSYSVRVNGVPVTAAEAAGLLSGAQSLEVFAKDTRG
jgi:hypothetical protein